MDTQYSSIRLVDGRRLSYSEFGDPNGSPVIYCHGIPSSRAEGELTLRGSSAGQLGLRVIIPDRPGMGRSDFKVARRIVDWANDVLELANALHFERFAVLGSSGGAPYALACGALVPDRVSVVGIVGGVAPNDAPSGGSGFMGRLARTTPAFVRALVRLQLLALRSQRVRNGLANAFPEPDRTLFQNANTREGFIACLEECCRNGPRGAVWELGLFSRPWGFALSSITVPVLLWQGERDGNVSAAHARYLAARIPQCDATFYPDDAHLSVMVNHHHEIFGRLRALALQNNAG